MAIIAPSILSADFSVLKDQILLAEEAGAKWFHLDVMDGHFVPNISFGPLVVEAVRKVTGQCLDVHLMIENPDTYIPQFVTAGSDILTVHAEATPHLNRSVSLIKQHGKKAGVAINPATPLSVLDHILQDVDLILVMSVNPGFGGQTFIDSTIPKIQKLANIIKLSGYPVQLEVDGGIDKSTAPGVIKAGGTVLVAGSAIFGSNDIKKATRELITIANSNHLV